MLDQVLALQVRSEFERASQWASKQGRKSPVRYVMLDLWIKDDEHAKAIEVELTQKFGTQGGGWRVYVASLKSFSESAGRCLFTNNSYYEPRRLSLAHVRPVAPAAVVESALNEIATTKANAEGSRE